ncbi:glycosyltransferase [Diaminobutyricibacter sp. McL0608]|uniref:glycosyltransferase n=1 Tax=Leifsonia sp. McL0608 TaxID=3143537 RepID=UPI0031F30DBA
MGDAPLVDAVIAVHDASRPIARAVDSLTTSGLSLSTGGELRITVVCHNLPVDEIRSVLPDRLSSVVRFIGLRDGIASAAGPFTAGIDAATGGYVSIMGSDDYLEGGALAAWLEHAHDGAVDAVIAPQVHAGGSKVRTPPVRPLRRGDLDPVKDRLAYRTAPLGLISRRAIERLGLAFPAGLRTGEDQSFSAKLWFGGGAIRFAAKAPRYVVGADAATRISLTRRALAEDLAFVDQLIDDPWFATLSPRARCAIAIKVVRIHVFDGVLARANDETWSPDDHVYASALVERLRLTARGFERPLSIADRKALDAIVDVNSSQALIAGRLRARRRFGRPETLVTRELSGLLAVEGPVRFMTASALL